MPSIKAKLGICARRLRILRKPNGLDDHTFYCSDIIIFTKILMMERKLSQVEANRLLEDVLIIISKENQLEKQNSQKSKNTLHLFSPGLSPKSPQKTKNYQHKCEKIELLQLQSDFNPEHSPEKNLMIPTTHKLPTQREEASVKEIGLDIQVSLKRNEEEVSSPQLSLSNISSPIKRQRFPSEMSIQSPLQDIEIEVQEGETLYLENDIKSVKRDLQIQSRGKLCKTQEINIATGQVTGYHLYCKNNSDCSFNCALTYAGKRSDRGQKLYRLTIHCDSHLKACMQEQQQIIFMKLTKMIDAMQQPIIAMLSQNGDLKPKQILTIMAGRMGEQNHKFIYKGLASKNYHKAAKKYFDNLIYKIKNLTASHDQ